MGRYSISEIFSNLISLIYTRIFFRSARLIRRPIFLRGRHNLNYGSGFTVGYNCRFDMPSQNKSTLKIGQNCKFGDNVHIVAYKSVTIGDDCLLASKIFISDSNHGCYTGDKQDSPNSIPDKRKIVTNPVNIGNKVWIGENVVILAGVSIGDGVVIGANSVVTKNIVKNSIVAGVPSKIIKQWDESEHIWRSVNEYR